MQNIAIVSYARTPIGDMLGCFKKYSATQLSAIANQAAIERAQLKPDDINEVILGCVLPAGLGQAPARQAAINAGIPASCGAITINKMCGSGLKAAMLGFDSIALGYNDIVIAGGMESMTNAPHLLLKARAGYRLGHGEIKDHMFYDGLEDIYDGGKLMGCFAEDTAEKFGFSRDDQDQFAITSLNRAIDASKQGKFKAEITAVGDITQDECPNPAKLEKIPRLKPAFKKDGTVTAANSSSISDGAASLVLMSTSEAEKRGIQTKAIIRAHATHSQQPAWFTTAPVDAIKKVLDKAGWTTNDVDLFEVNEAFAVVAMVAMKELDIPHEKLNIHGGACALGHPVGASGARITATLLNALEQYDLKKGVVGICLGGGEAVAMAIERV